MIVLYWDLMTKLERECLWTQIATLGTASVCILKFCFLSLAGSSCVQLSLSICLHFVTVPLSVWNIVKPTNISSDGKYMAFLLEGVWQWCLLKPYFSLWATPCPLKRNEIRDSEHEKGGGWTEMPGVDITGHKSLSQHSEAPALRQRENEKERGRRKRKERKIIIWTQDTGGDKKLLNRYKHVEGWNEMFINPKNKCVCSSSSSPSLASSSSFSSSLSVQV